MVSRDGVAENDRTLHMAIVAVVILFLKAGVPSVFWGSPDLHVLRVISAGSHRSFYRTLRDGSVSVAQRAGGLEFSCSLLLAYPAYRLSEHAGPRLVGSIGLVLHLVGYLCILSNTMGIFYTAPVVFALSNWCTINSYAKVALLFPQNVSLILTAFGIAASLSRYTPWAFGFGLFVESNVFVGIFSIVSSCVCALLHLWAIPSTQEIHRLMRWRRRHLAPITSPQSPNSRRVAFSVPESKTGGSTEWSPWVLLAVFCVVSFLRKKYILLGFKEILRELLISPRWAAVPYGHRNTEDLAIQRASELGDVLYILLGLSSIGFVFWSLLLNAYGVVVYMFFSNLSGFLTLFFLQFRWITESNLTTMVFLLHQSSVDGLPLAFCTSVLGFDRYPEKVATFMLLTGGASLVLDLLWPPLIMQNGHLFQKMNAILLVLSAMTFIVPIALLFLPKKDNLDRPSNGAKVSSRDLVYQPVVLFNSPNGHASQDPGMKASSTLRGLRTSNCWMKENARSSKRVQTQDNQQVQNPKTFEERNWVRPRHQNSGASGAYAPVDSELSHTIRFVRGIETLFLRPRNVYSARPGLQ